MGWGKGWGSAAKGAPNETEPPTVLSLVASPASSRAAMHCMRSGSPGLELPRRSCRWSRNVQLSLWISTVAWREPGLWTSVARQTCLSRCSARLASHNGTGSAEAAARRGGLSRDAGGGMAATGSAMPAAGLLPGLLGRWTDTSCHVCCQQSSSSSSVLTTWSSSWKLALMCHLARMQRLRALVARRVDGGETADLANIKGKR